MTKFDSIKYPYKFLFENKTKKWWWSKKKKTTKS